MKLEMRKTYDFVALSLKLQFFNFFTASPSVGDPDPEQDPDPQDPHVFGPLVSFPFLINVKWGLK